MEEDFYDPGELDTTDLAEQVGALQQQLVERDLRDLVGEYPELLHEEFSKPVLERAQQIARDHGYENPTPATLRHVLELSGLAQQQEADQQQRADPWDVKQALDDAVASRGVLPF